jgi:hypothetical protein
VLVMSRAQGSTLFLKSVIGLLGIGVLFLCAVLYLNIDEASDSEEEFLFLHILLAVF